MPDADLLLPESGFAGWTLRRPEALAGTRAAVLGVSAASPDKPGRESHAAGAPAALRAASMRFAPQLRQYDFDLGRSLLPADPDRAGPFADCGDLRCDPRDPAGNRARIEAATRRILAAGTAPIVLGGDDSVPIPVFAALDELGPLTLLQIDAHADWADEVAGNRYGYGSPMRRASELPWIASMVQVGLRGLGSGTVDQIDAARAWGSHLVTMRDWRRRGPGAVLPHIPAGGACFVSLDLDALDPGIMPAVNAPTPGGLDYQDVIELLHAVAGHARLAGAAVVEFVPRLDRDGLAALTAARLVAVLAGLIAGRADQEKA